MSAVTARTKIVSQYPEAVLATDLGFIGRSTQALDIFDLAVLEKDYLPELEICPPNSRVANQQEIAVPECRVHGTALNPPESEADPKHEV
jgi:hypothetical protein